MRTTLELVSVLCRCGKSVVKEIRAGSFEARVDDRITACPSCGSKDIKATREAEARKPRP